MTCQHLSAVRLWTHSSRQDLTSLHKRTPAASPFLQITGKVVSYQAGTHAGWSRVTVTADVGVELTVVPRLGSPFTLSVQGQCMMEQKEFMNLESAIPDSLDRALQECARKFLENETLLSLLKK